ncbi:MAG: DUF4410 domain-containing protein, partial [Vitreimonas sp.]
MRFVKAIGAAFALACLAACATGSTAELSRQEAAQGVAFSAFTIEAGEHAVDGGAEQIALFESELREQMTSQGFSQGAGLTVRYRLVQYNPGNRALRYFVGFGAGRGTLTFEVAFLDPSGTELARINVGGNITIGAFGGSFNEAITAAAGEAADYAE